MALINCPECQKEVSATAIACPYCGFSVKKHFDDIAAKELAEERKRKAQIKRSQIFKVLKFVLPITIITLVIVSGILINNKILSERMLFDDDDAMLKYLTDNNCWKLDSQYRNERLTFYSYGVSSIITENYSRGEKIKFIPRRGLFRIGSIQYSITSDGNIYNSVSDEKYSPGFYLNGLEDGIQALDFEILSAEMSEDGIFHSEYKITNTGNASYKFIMIETVLTYESGEKCILDDFEIVSSENDDFVLKPGDIGTATADLIDPKEKITNITAYVKEYMREL